jgi:hypothetical protein
VQVHERLTDAGKVYKERVAERTVQLTLYDSDGRRLFQPQIPRHPADEEASGK